jgi:hypothetical protein
MKNEDLDAAYTEMARDEFREAEALEWAEALIGDVADEARCPGSRDMKPTRAPNAVS